MVQIAAERGLIFGLRSVYFWVQCKGFLASCISSEKKKNQCGEAWMSARRNIVLNPEYRNPSEFLYFAPCRLFIVQQELGFTITTPVPLQGCTGCEQIVRFY